MGCANSLINVAFHPRVGVTGEIAAQNIGIMSSRELVAEFFHPNGGLGISLSTNQMHAFPENRDVRVSRF